MQQSWKRTLPGAIMSTAMWFLTTLIFGWYVTRFANYSQVYGSLGVAIALLFWLYIISSASSAVQSSTPSSTIIFSRPPADHSAAASPK